MYLGCRDIIEKDGENDNDYRRGLSAINRWTSLWGLNGETSATAIQPCIGIAISIMYIRSPDHI